MQKEFNRKDPDTFPEPEATKARPSYRNHIAQIVPANGDKPRKIIHHSKPFRSGLNFREWWKRDNTLKVNARIINNL